MPITALLDPEQVVVDLKATTKKQVLTELAAIAAERTGASKRDVFAKLLERERLGSTGLGKGIAIPHGRIEGLEKLFGIFARLAEPIEFDSVDDQPVDLVFLLLAPEEAGGEHLKALATVSRCFRDQGVCERLREAVDSASAHGILSDRIEADAA